MLAAAVIVARWGVAAERKPLEEVSRPLAACDYIWRSTARARRMTFHDAGLSVARRCPWRQVAPRHRQEPRSPAFPSN